MNLDELHARTMLAYERDGEKTARAIVIVFSAIAAFDGWLYLFGSGHIALGIAALMSLALVIFGMFLHIRHGKKIALWEDRLKTIENARRDREIIRRRQAGQATLAVDSITLGKIDTSKLSTSTLQYLGDVNDGRINL